MNATNNMNQLPKAARKTAGNALCNAAAGGDTQLVQELIDNGADVNWKNGKGLTPLHMAAYDQRSECFRILLNNGGDIHSRSNDGTYVFHRVARSEKLSNEFMQILIDRGASIHALGACGWNAIHFAAARGSTVCINMLYNLGLDINAKTNDDLTAYHIALSRGELAAAKLLQTLSAKTSSNSPDQIEMRRPSPGQANMEVDEPPSKRQARPNRCLQCKCKACVKKENQLTNQQCEIAELKHEVATTKERVRALEVERDVSGNGSSFFSATMTDLSSGDMLSKGKTCIHTLMVNTLKLL